MTSFICHQSPTPRLKFFTFFKVPFSDQLDKTSPSSWRFLFSYSYSNFAFSLFSQRLTARDCLNHQWLQIDEPNVSLTPASPVGQRRALTPPSSDSTPEEEPLKKCKCDDTAQSEADDRKDKLISEDHLLLNSHTPRILEDNNNISSPDSSTSPSLDIEAAKKSITMADQKENLSTATSGQEKKSLKCEGMVYTADATCLSQVEREAELLCW